MLVSDICSSLLGCKVHASVIMMKTARKFNSVCVCVCVCVCVLSRLYTRPIVQEMLFLLPPWGTSNMRNNRREGEKREEDERKEREIVRKLHTKTRRADYVSSIRHTTLRQ